MMPEIALEVRGARALVNADIEQQLGLRTYTERSKRVLVFVYALCGLLAGLGGVVMASQLKSGAPTYGQMYELYVIAAVVVGGTSLSGGEGSLSIGE